MAKEVQNATAALSKETEERRHLFETSLDLILITDRQGSYVQVSPSAAAILGHKPEEMIGRNAAEFVYPDDLDGARQELRLAPRPASAQLRMSVLPQGRQRGDARMVGRLV